MSCMSSCAEAVEKIAEARNKGFDVWGETCPQYLVLINPIWKNQILKEQNMFGHRHYEKNGHQDVLWNALKTGNFKR